MRITWECGLMRLLRSSSANSMSLTSLYWPFLASISCPHQPFAAPGSESPHLERDRCNS
jgi:hypothetical protein